MQIGGKSAAHRRQEKAAQRKNLKYIRIIAVTKRSEIKKSLKYAEMRLIDMWGTTSLGTFIERREDIIHNHKV